MQIPIDDGHFFAGQDALSVVYPRYMSESATQSCRKWPRPEGLALQRGHPALRIAYLDLPNHTLRALTGPFGEPTLGICIVLTGPSSGAV